MALEGTVNTPFGKLPKKQALIVGLGGLSIGGFVYYRYRQQSKADQAAASSAGAGANTGIDPATGYAYGSAEDAAALSNQGNYVAPADSSSWVGGQVVGYDQNGNPVYSSGATTYPYGTAPGSFTNNPQWANYVEDYLTNTVSEGAAAVSSAIGKYLTGRPVTPAEYSIINQAIAIGGPPPVADVSGYPPSIHQIPPPSGGGSGSSAGKIWEWHSGKHELTHGGKRADHASGNATIRNNTGTFFWHHDLKKFTKNGHAAHPHTGKVTWK